MIPLKTTVTTKKFPLVTFLFIIINIIIFFYEISLKGQITPLIQTAAIIPARYFQQNNNSALSYLALLSSMFLHGGWAHLIGNMWFLWLFGGGVEDRMGHFNFVIFYLLSGILANIVHILTNTSSLIPVIGASGAISGVLGAYMFLFPYSRVITMVPFFLFFPIIRIYAFFFLGYWFFLQFLNGIAPIETASYGGIAWWTHIGGFISGIILLPMFIKRKTTQT